MNKNILRRASVFSLLAMTFVLSLSAKAATLESEMSQVTLFVEGMMKSRGGVTWLSWPSSVVAALSELPGIKSDEDVEMILDRDAFTIEYDGTLTTLDDMYSAILDLGYVPRLASEKVSNADTQVANGEVPQPIADALIQARAMSKILLVDFFAEWCLACKALDEQTLSSEKVQSALAGYIFVKVDTDQFPQSAVYYDVVGMPTLLVLDAQGNEAFRSVGSISAADLSKTLESLNPH